MKSHKLIPALLAVFLVASVHSSLAAPPLRCGEEDSSGGACVWGRVEAFDESSLQIRGLKIVLAGIQAPERTHLCFNRKSNKSFDCAQIARRRIGEMVAKNGAACSILDGQSGHLVGVCRAVDGDMGQILVEAGAAKPKDAPYEDALITAIQGQKGLWGADIQLPKEWESYKNKTAKSILKPDKQE